MRQKCISRYMTEMIEIDIGRWIGGDNGQLITGIHIFYSLFCLEHGKRAMEARGIKCKFVYAQEDNPRYLILDTIPGKKRDARSGH